MEHTILTGPKGGQYWLDENNKKHYVSSPKPKSTANKLPNPSQQPKVHKKETPKLHRYICYYTQRDENGEMVDDFKEWCDAYSRQEAKDEFESRYWRGIARGTITIDDIIEK